MKIPVPPPDIDQALIAMLRTPEGLRDFARLTQAKVGPAPDGKYRAWDTFRHVQRQDGLTIDHRWIAVKMARRAMYQPIPLHDKVGKPFQYALPAPALEMLHRIDQNASGTIQVSEQVTNPHTRDTYLLRSLVEEAITSSQLEGASTTRQVAKEMIKSNRAPVDRSERMILNNYHALQYMRGLGAGNLTPEVVCNLQRMLTEETLDTPDAVGRLRRADEAIQLEDEVGRVLHVPPPAGELPGRLQALCDFANATNDSGFIHPVVRAITLHFWLGYDHPFVDGNGRTARALFYWCMARHGYWLCEFVSISRILKRARAAYGRAFLYTEGDDNDLTYFLLYQLDVLQRAIADLHEYLTQKQTELRQTEEVLKASGRLRAALSPRQLALLSHSLRHSDAEYTVQSHRESHGVAYQTARTDLLALVKLGLLRMARRGREFVFHPSPTLSEIVLPGGGKHAVRHLAKELETRD